MFSFETVLGGGHEHECAWFFIFANLMAAREGREEPGIAETKTKIEIENNSILIRFIFD